MALNLTEFCIDATGSDAAICAVNSVSSSSKQAVMIDWSSGQASKGSADTAHSRALTLLSLDNVVALYQNVFTILHRGLKVDCSVSLLSIRCLTRGVDT